jgi:ATP-binding cassette subfamily B protein
MLVDLGWLTRQAFGDAPLPCAAWSVVAVVRGLLVPAQLLLTRLLLDALQARLSGKGTGSGHALWWLGVLAATLLMDRVLGGCLDWLRALARERQGPAAQARVLERAAALDLATFEYPEYYDRARRVLSGTEGRVPDAVGQVVGLGQLVPSFCGYVAALAVLSPTLLVVTVLATLPTVLAWTILGQAAWGASAALTRVRRLADAYAGLLTGRGPAAEVRLYGLGAHIQQRWSELFWVSRNGERAQVLRYGSGLRSLATASVAVSMVALWLVLLHGGHGLEAGGVAVLLQSVEGVFGGGFRIGAAARQLGEHSGFAAEYRAFFRATAPVPPPPGVPSGGHRLQRAPAIRVANVTFTYPGAASPALRGIALQLAPGETVALVGENGAGKTTLAKVLLGLYRPEVGGVLVDGVPVERIAPNAFSAVFQDFAHYPLSLAENVTLGASPDDARLGAALAAVGEGGLARELPEGADTVLGVDIGGTDLSGGQWQRVALARALWRQAHVLVLDEPTAALDPLAELALFRQFAALARGRTTVLVSHRLGSCRLADRVVVLRAGRIAEQGAHDRLLASGGVYAEMFAAQARWYV